MKKQVYTLAPQIDVAEVRPEEGFAASGEDGLYFEDFENGGTF